MNENKDLEVIEEPRADKAEITMDQLDSITKELGLSAEANEKITKLRKILDGTEEINLEENMGTDTYSREYDDIDIFAEADKASEGISLIDIAINGINNNTIGTEELLAACSETMPGLKPEDLSTLLSIAKRYKDGEEFNIYAEMPEVIQSKIRHECVGSDMPSIKLTAKLILEEFCTEVFSVTMDKECVDFNEALKQALDLPDISQLYEDYIKDRMEKDLITKADELQEEFPDGAALLRRCSAAFTDSYTFTREKAAITGKVRRKLYKDNEFYNRFCNDFNHRNSKSKFKIPDIFEFGRVLDKLAPHIGISKEDVSTVVILICKTCLNYNGDDTVDGVFMYYTLRNVMNIEHHIGVFDVAEPSFKGFDQIILNNIIGLVDHIHMIVNKKEEVNNVH